MCTFWRSSFTNLHGKNVVILWSEFKCEITSVILHLYLQICLFGKSYKIFFPFISFYIYNCSFNFIFLPMLGWVYILLIINMEFYTVISLCFFTYHIFIVISRNRLQIIFSIRWINVIIMTFTLITIKKWIVVLKQACL